MNKKDKNLRDLIINWEENHSVDIFKEILVLIKNEKFYSPVNESNDFEIEKIVSLEGKLYIPVYIGIEESVTNNKSIRIYTLKDYKNVLEENNNDNIERTSY